MKTRDLPHAQLAVYASTLVAMELPTAWLDLPFFGFIVWLDLARKDPGAARLRWEHLQAMLTESASILQPILAACPSLTMDEAIEIMQSGERDRFMELGRAIVAMG